MLHVMPGFWHCFSATDTVFTSRFSLRVTVCLLAYEDTRSEEYANFVNSISEAVSTECCRLLRVYKTYHKSASLSALKACNCMNWPGRVGIDLCCAHLLYNCNITMYRPMTTWFYLSSLSGYATFSKRDLSFLHAKFTRSFSGKMIHNKQ